MVVPAFQKPEFNFLRSKAPWRTLLEGILGKDAVLTHAGVMLSLPGSTTQPWHSDGDHLSGKKHRPPHCVTLFIPLVQLTPEVRSI
jgi:ectoine hydroxylase-related dioxygenase (phytanoyl-CoA dioxygenase family)